MTEAVVQLYEAGGLSLVIVVMLASACVLLYRELRAMRERLLEAEVSHVRQLVRIWQRLSEARGERDSIVEAPPSLPPPGKENVRALNAERDRAWALIEHNLEAIAKRDS